MTAPPAVHLEHVAGGCNRTVGALDWGESGLIAFATHNAIAIYDPQTCNRPILATLQGHAGAVTCLRWFRASHFGSTALPPTAPLALVSGGADGAVCVWLLPPAPSTAPWTLAATLPGHTAPVTSVTLAADPAAPGRLLLVTTAGDGNVGVWSAAAKDPEALFSPEIWHQDQILAYGTRIQHCAALAPLPLDPGAALLALGGVDGRLRFLLRGAAAGAPFRPVCELDGHQNWLRGLDFVQQGPRLLLASASQDRCVRLWTVGPETGESSGGTDPLTRLAPRPRFLCPNDSGGRWYAAAAEALLLGHEDWVHSVAWKPQQTGVDSDNNESPCLLSASMDRTMALWVADAATGLWLSAESVGDAGVNHLGYYTGVWAPDGAAVAAHGYTGALHVWHRTSDGGLVPAPAVGGHCGAVVDATWAADGGCLLTVSTDQTARITTKLASTGAWCEIARPQVHGHDFACVAAIPAREEEEESDAEGRFLYASGSEEKVIRVFEAPRTFYDTLALARGHAAAAGAAAAAPAFGATLPALGLSNKAVYSAEEALERDSGAAEPGLGGGEYNAAGPDVAPAAAPSAVAGPPLEEHLAGSTLWPEIHKLYGHGNELYCLAAAPGGRVIASACRAQSAPVAAILLWDTATWTPRATLQAHSLTVTQLAFSPDGAALASASRDRSVAVFRRPQGSSNDSLDFSLSVHLPKAHARIVWGVAWAPDSTLLATASRDGTAKVWAAVGDSLAPLASVKFDEGVHSVAFAPRELPAGGESGQRRCLAAVGLESGKVVVGVVSWSIGGSESSASWAEVWRTPTTERHASAVRRVCWRAEEGEERYELASCGDDHGLRVFSVDGIAAAAAAAGGTMS